MSPLPPGRIATASPDGSWCPRFWGAVSIVAMWLAVLFDGIFGGDTVFSNPSSAPTTIPSAVTVALFAFVGTAVAKRAFTRRGLD